MIFAFSNKLVLKMALMITLHFTETLIFACATSILIKKSIIYFTIALHHLDDLELFFESALSNLLYNLPLYSLYFCADQGDKDLGTTGRGRLAEI